MAGGFQNSAFQTEDAFQPESGVPPRLQAGSNLTALLGPSKNDAQLAPSWTQVDLDNDGHLTVELD